MKLTVQTKNALLITIGWSISASSIILQALYERPTPIATDILLLATISIIAGALLADAKRVILGYIFSTILSLFITFTILASPMFLGLAKHTELYQVFYSGIITMMFRYMFPTTFITCLIGAILGGFLGEEYLY